jgi:hypothetical protein
VYRYDVDLEITEMGRRSAAPVADQLLDEAQAIELLLDEVAPDSTEIETYWQISMELIALVGRIEELVQLEGVDAADARYVALRAELSSLESRITELLRTADA